MRDIPESLELDTTGDGFTLVAGSVRVKPSEYPAVAPLELVMPVVAEALMAAGARVSRAPRQRRLLRLLACPPAAQVRTLSRPQNHSAGTPRTEHRRA